MSNRHKNIKNLSDIEPYSREHGTRIGLTGKRIGVEAGNTMVGCSWFEVPPGRQAFPNHYHCANEESIFILTGQGEVQIGSETHTVGPNDFISFPPGPDHSHALKNTGSENLTYLCMSSMLPTEVAVYPDSNKIGIFGGDDAGKGFGKAPWVMKFIKDQPSEAYYEGESTD